MTEASATQKSMPLSGSEIPWEPQPAPALDDLETQHQKLRSVGSHREITPCPSSGRISFKQIGDLREYVNKPVSMDDSRLLNCRKPEAVSEGNKLIYQQSEPTNDPSDFYSALWGSEGNVARGKELPMNPIDTWNENFSGTYPTDSDREQGFGYRSLTASGSGFIAQAKSPSEYVFIRPDPNNPGYGIYDWVYYQVAVYAVAYIGRFDAGTRLSICFETVDQTGGQAWEKEMAYYNIRGWSQGFFNGSATNYASGRVHSRGGGEDGSYTFVHDIQIDDLHKDLWIAFQQSSQPNNDDVQKFALNNFWIWRT